MAASVAFYIGPDGFRSELSLIAQSKLNRSGSDKGNRFEPKGATSGHDYFIRNRIFSDSFRMHNGRGEGGSNLRPR